MNPDGILQTKLMKLFPDPEKRSAAEAELRRYGTEFCENEPARVRLAVLKISGADLDRIRSNIATAKQDYRDIPAYAEYPRQMGQDSWKLSPAQNRALVAADRRGYEEWLRE
jgi:hypothetical protein